MSRNLTAAMETQLQAPVSRPALLGKFEYDSGNVYLWSGVGPLSYDGQTWLGVGQWLSIDFPEERSDGSSEGAVFTLSGMDASAISLALTENSQNRPCTIWYAEFNENFSALILDPCQPFKGKMDTMVIEDQGETGSITLTVERMHFDNRTANERYDHQEQLRLFPGDLGLEFLPQLQEAAIPWGVPDSQTGGSGSPNLGNTGPVGPGRTRNGGSNPGGGAGDSGGGGWVRGQR